MSDPKPSPEWAVAAAEQFLNEYSDGDLSTSEALAAIIVRHAPPQINGTWGHEQPCYFCGEQCNSLAGNPSLWPIPLCHSDEPGVVKAHHIGCVSERLHAPAESAPSQPDHSKELRVALGAYPDSDLVSLAETLTAIQQQAAVVFPLAQALAQAVRTAHVDGEGMQKDCAVCAALKKMEGALSAVPQAPAVSVSVGDYLRARRATIEASIAAEELAGNSFKEQCERTALAEITALEIELTRAGRGTK